MLYTTLNERPVATKLSSGSEPANFDLMLKKIAQGSKLDLKALYDATGPRLFAVLIRMIGRREIAEDLLQETFISIWCKAHQFDARRGNAMAWLYSIARRKAIDRLRMSNREQVGALEDVATSESLFSHEVNFIDPETRISIQRCLHTLKPEHFQTIRLCYAYGLTHEEIAAHLNVPLGTVKSWVRRGLEQIKLSMTTYQSANDFDGDF